MYEGTLVLSRTLFAVAFRILKSMIVLTCIGSHNLFIPLAWWHSSSSERKEFEEGCCADHHEVRRWIMFLNQSTLWRKGMRKTKCLLFCVNSELTCSINLHSETFIHIHFLSCKCCSFLPVPKSSPYRQCIITLDVSYLRVSFSHVSSEFLVLTHSILEWSFLRKCSESIVIILGLSYTSNCHTLTKYHHVWSKGNDGWAAVLIDRCSYKVAILWPVCCSH